MSLSPPQSAISSSSISILSTEVPSAVSKRLAASGTSVSISILCSASNTSLATLKHSDKGGSLGGAPGARSRGLSESWAEDDSEPETPPPCFAQRPPPVAFATHAWAIFSSRVAILPCASLAASSATKRACKDAICSCIALSWSAIEDIATERARTKGGVFDLSLGAKLTREFLSQNGYR